MSEFEERPSYVRLVPYHLRGMLECLPRLVANNQWFVERVVTWIWGASVIYAAALMLRPKPEYAEALLLNWSHADLAAHCSLFGYLTLMPNLTRWGRRNAFRCTVGLLIFGAFLEYGQTLTGDRTASLADALANTVGVSLGCVLGHLLRRRSGAGAN